MAARPAAITTIANPVQIHTYATMIDGVTEGWSQPREPGERLAEVRRGQAELIVALRQTGDEEPPVGAGG